MADDKELRLTKSFIDRTPVPSEGYVIHWDSTRDPRGYGLRVNAGGTKSFVLQGRLHGRSILFTVGSYGELTEAQARAQARDIRHGLRNGVDPREARRRPKDVPTLRQLADEYTSRPNKAMKPSAIESIDRVIKTVFAAKEHRPITEITEGYCIERFERIRDRGLNGDRKGGAPGQANQCHAVMHALMEYAIRKKKGITVNPAKAITKEDRVTLAPRTAYIKPTKIGEVWNWLREQRARAYTQIGMGRLDLVQFLLLTGCRLSEATELTWDRVSVDEAWWFLPDPKNRTPITLPLCSQALDMLKVRRLEVPKNVQWVFPSDRSKSGHMEDPRDLWPAISALAGEPISAHDCRRSWTNYALRECDLDYYRVELLTGHRPTSVTLKHYTDTSDLRRWTAEVQKVADFIEKKAAIASSSNVVELPTRKTGMPGNAALA